LIHKEVMGNTECPVHLSYDCCNRYVLKYSTDIAAAWQVIKKFEHWRIETDPEDDAGLYHVDIWIEKGCYGVACTAEIPVKAESITHAICLAALKAKGVNDG